MKRKLTTVNYKQTNIDTIIISQTKPAELKKEEKRKEKVHSSFLC
jgi:hypothetical protein